MTNYEQKVQEKRSKYSELAERNSQMSSRLWKDGNDSLSAIPFGQPILVGHHSERPMRNYIQKAYNKLNKAVELEKKADYCLAKAEGYGTHIVSSDDPEAIEKLYDKLSQMKLAHTIMTDRNKDARKNKLETPYAPYQLQNSNARIKATEKRIKSLEAERDRESTQDVIGNGWKMTEDKEENRIMFIFNAKPEDGRIKLLKGRGFKWSPTRSAWVRQINNAGRYAAKIIINSL